MQPLEDRRLAGPFPADDECGAGLENRAKSVLLGQGIDVQLLDQRTTLLKILQTVLARVVTAG